jgi:hypothetical protein
VEKIESNQKWRDGAREHQAGWGMLAPAEQVGLSLGKILVRNRKSTTDRVSILRNLITKVKKTVSEK